MCEPTTLAAIGSFFAGTGGAATAGVAGLTSAGAAGAAGLAAGSALAGTAATALTTAQTVALGLSAASAITGGLGLYQQNQTAKAVAEGNARTAEQGAKDALARGEKDAQAAMRESRQMVGSQRAAYSARGLDISSGTPADVIEQTDFFGQADSATARTNARKEAYGYRARGAGYAAEARSSNPMLSLTGTLLGGAASVSDRWFQYGGRG